MNIGRLGLALAVCLLASGPAAAADDVLLGPAPEWVEVVPAATSESEENGLPVRVLSMDSQIRFEDGRQSTYAALAIKLQTPEGLAGGNLQFAWRPETQDLTVHKVVIRRGDETIDVLASGQTFTVLRREQNLEQAMLDGTLTATMFPEGLQVGDVLEFASTLTTRDPVLAGHREIAMGPLNGQIDRMHWRLQWPAGEEIELAKTDDLPEWRRTREDGFETVEFTLENVEPLPLPRLAPLRYAMVRYVEASDFSSWAEAAALEIPLYEQAAKIPAEGPLRAEVERIRESSSDQVARAEAALALVQGRIRYVALAMGAGGLVPATAEETWARRYGDCKAKTALLLAILHELGIEAHGVAVNTQLGDTVAQRVPSVWAFDHILVRARIEGRDYWLDGTRTGDTSLAKLQVPAFGWGLPIVEGAELVRMVPAPLDQPHSDMAIHMDASKGVRAPVPTRVELTLRGDTAIGTNQAFANFTGAARDRTLREFWRQRFDFIEPESVGLTYDNAAMELRLTLEGQATMEWDGVWYETDETGLGYQADFSREPGPGSDAPYAVGHPFYTRTRQTIVLPPGFSAPTSDDLNVDETVAGVEYHRRTTFSDNTLFIEASERSVAPEFEAEDATAFEKRLRELWDNAVYLRLPSSYRPTDADIASLLSAMPEDFDELVADGRELIGAGKYRDALARFTRAIELQPNNAELWADRGYAHTMVGSLEEAEADFAKVESLDPTEFKLFTGRGALAERRRDFPAAVAAYTKAIDLRPDNVFPWGHRAQAQVALSRSQEALSDAAKALELSPVYVDMYALRAFVLKGEGRRAEAKAEIDAMLAANPDNSYAVSLAGQIYNDLGLEAEAQALVERAVADMPTSLAYYNKSRLRDPADTEGKLADLDEALRLEPAFALALMERASLHYRAGNSESALADVDELLRNDHRFSDAYLLRANILRSMGRREDALAVAESVVAANPDETFAHVVAGRIYSFFGLREQAIAEMDRALAIKPEGYIYINRSEVRDPDDWEARLADLDEALRLSPDDPAALSLKAVLLTEHGDPAAAAAVAGQAAEADPDNPSLLNSHGIALARAGQMEEAEVAFAAARELAIEAMALNNLCYSKAVANVALERALEECEEALRLLPDNAAILDSRGAVLLRLGRLDESIRDFDRVLEQHPGMTNSRYLRAVARSRQGNMAGAEEDLAMVRDAEPALIEQMKRDGFVVAGAENATAERAN